VNRAEAVLLHSPEVERYSYPESSPFKTQRAGLLRGTLVSMGLLNAAGRREHAPAAATRAELERFHTARYLDALQAAERGALTPEGFAMGLGTPDCPVFRGMYAYAALAAGASITAARLILSGGTRVAFNPSGGFHHAHAARAAGFCYVNDVVLAAQTLAEAGRRVLCLDLDVHHGDGVQAAFYARRDVMTISLHETGSCLFPGTGFEDEIGVGEGAGFSVNVPLPVGTYDAAYRRAFQDVALPLMKAFDADVTVLQIGMDGLAGDPLAHLHLTNNVYADILGIVRGMGKPILAVGGGGYHVENTVRGWALAWSVLCGEPEHDLSAGMGGVMLENVEWFGGLRDRVLLSDAGLRREVDDQIRRVTERIRATVFPLHGL
jgi:acetoin utilization protein AcuC